MILKSLFDNVKNDKVHRQFEKIFRVRRDYEFT